MEKKRKSSDNQSTPTKKCHWSQGLLESMKDPELIVQEDELVVAIRDKYPKAAFHYLICPKANIPSLKSVKIEHLSLLKHMEKIGAELSIEHKDKKFIIGYHAVPSMTRLHLHCISDDFNSSFLKTKKHWNSFTTKYFVPSALIIKQLESGKLYFPSDHEAKNLLETKLKCHKCNYFPKNMPDLKKHILIHN